MPGQSPVAQPAPLLRAGQADGAAFCADDGFTAWAEPGRPADRPGWRDADRLPPGKKPARPWAMPPQADVVYCYDGSFAGFLCGVFASFARRQLPFALWPPQAERATLYPAEEIATRPEQAQRLWQGFRALVGGAGCRLVRTAFLSGQADKEMLLLRFFHLAFAEGAGVLALLGHPDVAPVYALDKAVGREAEHLKGFLRFEEADGMLGAVIHPKNQVLPLLRGHFCARYPDERFLIYDAAHSQALLYQNGRARLVALAAPLALPRPDEKECYYQALWKQFYDTLAIRERRNEALRRQNCPKRFWADMTELADKA